MDSASCMNFVVDDLELIKQSSISTSCLGLLVVAAAAGIPLQSFVLAPNSHNSPRCWQAANLPNLNGVIEQRITLPASSVKLDKHKYLNLEQASLDQLFPYFPCTARLLGFLSSSFSQGWTFQKFSHMEEAHFLVP